MRVYEKRTRTEIVETTVCVEITCDLCGSFGYRDEAGGVIEWASSVWKESLTHLMWHEGVHHPDGGRYKIKREVDLCPTCFKGRLMPWLRSQGVAIREEESDS